MIKIGLFSLKDNIGCTSISIHMANYLADIEGKTVAIVEPKKKGILNSSDESAYAYCNVDYEDDGTFVANKVRFYPAKRRKAWQYDKFELCEGNEVEPTEDIVIYDFGKVGFLHEFESDFNKLYLCTDGQDIADEVSFVKDTKTNPDIILFGVSKDVLANYQSLGFKCILIGNKKEDRLPRNFASSLEIFLRLNGITPPAYHKDWTYAPIEFNYRPAPAPQEKQGLFGKMFGKKKKIEVAKPEIPEPKEIIASDISVASFKKASDANVFRMYNYVDVPAPEDDEEEIIEETIEDTPVISEAKKPEESTEEIKEEQNKEDSPFISEDEVKKAADILARERLKEYELVENAKAKVKEAEFKTKLSNKQKEADELKAKQKEADKKAKEADEKAKKLEWEATHDEMTKLLNKRAFSDAIKAFDVTKGALIFIDINNLKQTNDNISHAAGDKLILAVAQNLHKNFENESYRIGGDEFIILTDKTKKEIDKKIRCISKELDTLTKKDKEKIIYSISYGISYCDGIKDIFTLKSEADALMYDYKRKYKEVNKQEEPAAKPKVPSDVKGPLGKLIKYILNNEGEICNMFIVTKDKSLILFDDPNVFFEKLELLKREIRSQDRIHYIIVTHMSEDKSPFIITDDEGLSEPFVLLEALDDELKQKGHLTDEEIERHYELIVFKEVINT